MPSFVYKESEVLERRTSCKVLGNGTVTAGNRYVNDNSVRIDVIVMKKNAIV